MVKRCSLSCCGLFQLQDVSEVILGCGVRVLEAGVSEPGHSARAFCIPQSQVSKPSHSVVNVYVVSSFILVHS